MTLTPEVFVAVCPNCPHARVRRIVNSLRLSLVDSTITTKSRLAAFLAQCAHESGEFRWWSEFWGPTTQQAQYEPPSALAKRLGNTHPGDGARYRGRGPLMLTGRYNYTQAALRLGLPIDADPDMVAQIPTGCRVAVDYWDANGLSVLANDTAEGFRILTRRINGGTYGLAQREAYHATARTAMGLDPVM